MLLSLFISPLEISYRFWVEFSCRAPFGGRSESDASIRFHSWGQGVDWNDLLRRNDFHRSQCHRAEQARCQQGRVFPPMMPRRESQPSGGTGLVVEQPLRPRFEPVALPFAIGRQLFVANQPVWPKVGHLDDQM